jgi:hypothetical protein
VRCCDQGAHTANLAHMPEPLACCSARARCVRVRSGMAHTRRRRWAARCSRACGGRPPRACAMRSSPVRGSSCWRCGSAQVVALAAAHSLARAACHTRTSPRRAPSSRRHSSRQRARPRPRRRQQQRRQQQRRLRAGSAQAQAPLQLRPCPARRLALLAGGRRGPRCRRCQSGWAWRGRSRSSHWRHPCASTSRRCCPPTSARTAP